MRFLVLREAQYRKEDLHGNSSLLGLSQLPDPIGCRCTLRNPWVSESFFAKRLQFARQIKLPLLKSASICGAGGLRNVSRRGLLVVADVATLLYRAKN